MIPFGKVGEHIVAEPFRPFRISLSCGKHVDILQPEMILLGRSSVRVYGSNGKSGSWEDLALSQMRAIESISA